MSRINRNILHSGRRHHGPQQNVRSIFLDGTTDFIAAGNNYGLNNTPADNTANPVPDQNNTAYLWRLLNTIHLNDGAGLNYNFSVDPIASQFGETAMSVAMWFKPVASADQGGLPVSRTTSVTTNTWKTIWMSDQNTSLTDVNGGIGIGIWYEGSTQSNYFAMFKYGGVSGAPGRAIRVGTVTPVLENIGDQSTYNTYTPTWFHVAFKFGNCNQDSWKMWVNGILQDNDFGSNNLGYDGTELSTNAYCYASQVVEDAYSSTTDSSILGGGFGRTTNTTPLYIGGHFADFNYWHASLSNHDVAALYNWGSLYGDGTTDARLAPTSNFTVTGDELVGNYGVITNAAIQNDQSWYFDGSSYSTNLYLTANPTTHGGQLDTGYGEVIGGDHVDFSFAEDTGADPDTPFTFAMWVKPTGGAQSLFEKVGPGGPNYMDDYEYRVFVGHQNQIYVDKHEVNATVYQRNTTYANTLPPNVWSHVMITKSAVYDSVRVWINGVEAATNGGQGGYSHPNYPDQMVDTTGGFHIGQMAGNASYSGNEINFCQFMMWKGYEADQNAVTYLYGAGAVHRNPLHDNAPNGYTGASSLKLWLPLHTDANDLSGNNHHFTSVNTAVTTGAGNSPFLGNQL